MYRYTSNNRIMWDFENNNLKYYINKYESVSEGNFMKFILYVNGGVIFSNYILIVIKQIFLPLKKKITL